MKALIQAYVLINNATLKVNPTELSNIISIGLVALKCHPSIKRKIEVSKNHTKNEVMNNIFDNFHTTFIS
jgi:hypothetical protein